MKDLLKNPITVKKEQKQPSAPPPKKKNYLSKPQKKRQKTKAGKQNKTRLWALDDSGFAGAILEADGVANLE